MSFLEYVKKDTCIHRLHPLTKILILICFVFIAGIFWDYRYYLMIIPIGVLLNRLARIPKSWYKFMATIIVMTFPTTMYLAVFQTNPELYKVYPYELVSKEVVMIRLPFLGKAGITYGNMLWFLGWECRTILSLLAVFVFTHTTSPAEVAHLTVALKLPQSLTYLYTVAMRFVPYMLRLFLEITSIQRLRGWRIPSKWNIYKIVKSLYPLARPLTARMATLSEDITMAAQIRAFGSGKTTSLVQLKLTPLNWLISALCVIAMIVALVGMIFYKIGLI